MTAPTAFTTCAHCGGQVPALTLSPDDLARVGEANRCGSPTLAAAELAGATGCSTEAAAWLAHLNACAYALPLSDADEAVLARVTQAFARVERPDPFVRDPDHCLECAEHEATLQAAARTHLSREALGGSGWDPMCFCGEQGMAYFFPTLARFALLPDVLAREWYGDQLLFHLSYDRFRHWCSPAQRAAVADFLTHLAHSRQAHLEGNCLENDMTQALAVWAPAGA